MRARALATLVVAVMLAGVTVAAAGRPRAHGHDAARTRMSRTVITTVPVSDSQLIPVTTDQPGGNPQPRPLRRLVRTYADGSRVLLPGHRVIAFYGAAGAPGLGVLGTGTPDQVWRRLARVADTYRRPHGPRVMPALELITYLATSGPGADGNYSGRVPDAVIGRYLRAARRHHGLLILDLQPGRATFLSEAKSLRRWLRSPFVQLGLDPEWKLYGNQRPLSRIGHTNAAAINQVSSWLSDLVAHDRLPQKLLLVHEFTDDMVRNDANVVSRPHVAVVFNIDGFGSKAAKVGRYDSFARTSRLPLGFKLFYDLDAGLMTPGEVLRLRPRPVVVEYE
jgi:hypothetical protein